MMKLRLADSNELPQIMEIIAHAQQYLASQNINQWQDGYPPKEWIANDIAKKECYVVENNESHIIATTVFIKGVEPTYREISGNWMTDEKANYGVIHRLAIHEKYRRNGIAEFIISELEIDLRKNKFTSMRIDTHEDNTGMQRLLKKIGYQYCGVIYLEDGNERLAFEKVI